MILSDNESLSNLTESEMIGGVETSPDHTGNHTTSSKFKKMEESKNFENVINCQIQGTKKGAITETLKKRRDGRDFKKLRRKVFYNNLES